MRITLGAILGLILGTLLVKGAPTATGRALSHNKPTTPEGHEPKVRVYRNGRLLEGAEWPTPQ